MTAQWTEGRWEREEMRRLDHGTPFVCALITGKAA